MRRFLAVTVMLAAAATSANAQSALLDNCAALPVPGGTPAAVQSLIQSQNQVLCAQVVSAVQNVQPTIGIAFSAANPTLGTASTIGKRLGMFPRISVSARANIALADMPDLFNGFSPTLTTSQLPAMGTSKVPVASLQGDVALGIFNGLSLGPAISGLGAVDLLGSVSFVPTVQKAGIQSTIFNFGGGARVGIIKQGILMPGVSLTGMYRRMGDVTFGDINSGDPAQFTTNLQDISLRAMISKGLLLLDVAAGGGYDIYKSDIDMQWNLTCDPAVCGGVTALTFPGQVSGSIQTAAWNVFADAGISLFLLHVVAEVGYQKPTSVIGPADLQNASLPSQDLVSKDLSGGRLFGSVGVRIVF
ncbi:MAG TPA: hypothetical protein VJ957_03125 [Longimicrobiales bacterium]|nr:hypothetical protein [Longimicrobiales bacterium]